MAISKKVISALQRWLSLFFPVHSQLHSNRCHWLHNSQNCSCRPKYLLFARRPILVQAAKYFESNFRWYHKCQLRQIALLIKSILSWLFLFPDQMDQGNCSFVFQIFPPHNLNHVLQQWLLLPSNHFRCRLSRTRIPQKNGRQIAND